MSKIKIKSRDRLKKYFSNIELDVIKMLKQPGTEEEKVAKIIQKYGKNVAVKRIYRIFDILEKNLQES